MNTGSQHEAGTGRDVRAANRRTGFALLSVALVFFLGILIKYWLLG
jgi:hypothetical protein